MPDETAPAPFRVGHALRLFEYDLWANARVLDAIGALGTRAPARALERMAHVAWAGRLWHSRVAGAPAPTETAFFDGARTPASIGALAGAAAADWRSTILADGEPGLARIVRYTNTKGVAYASSTADIVSHVINHATYHRGQVACDLSGLAPASVVTDFIAWSRGD